MADNLDSFYVTFKVYKDNSVVHSFECPISLLNHQYLQWIYPSSPYKVEIFNHDGTLRFGSNIGINTIEVKTTLG